jgi:S1-C subfamily serine protease
MEVKVRLNDGNQLTGKVVKIDKSADLAIVKVEAVKRIYNIINSKN